MYLRTETEKKEYYEKVRVEQLRKKIFYDLTECVTNYNV